MKPRVGVYLSEQMAARLAAGANNGAGKVQLELPALQGVAATVTPSRVLVLPSVDPLSLTQTVRADLPAAIAALEELAEGDAVLVKGSRMAGMEKVADALLAG